MKKRILITILATVLAVNISACNYVPESDINENTDGIPEDTYNTSGENVSNSKDNTTEELEILQNPNFAYSPFFTVVEGADKLTDDEMKFILLNLPADKYEIYPNLHNVPLTATLYNGDDVVPIALNDPRLIKLVNLYNNSVYYRQYYYTQGLLNIEYLEKEVLNEDFRLVLTFSAKNTGDSVSYDTNIQAYDTIVVTNKWFVLLGHDLPGYEGQEDKYPFRAIGHTPLFNDYCWLDLFGF